MAEWQLKVPAGVVPKNLPVYIALGIVSVLLLVMFLTGSGAPSDESAAGREQAITEPRLLNVMTFVQLDVPWHRDLHVLVLKQPPLLVRFCSGIHYAATLKPQSTQVPLCLS